MFIFAGCYRATLKNTVEEINYRYPALVAPGITATGVELEGEYVVYRHSVNETQCNLMALGEISPEEKLAELREKGVDEKEFLRLVRRSGMGLKYEYFGEGSGIIVSCTIENDML
ncbi:MAG: hypothetical protein II793_01975 [Bacteroidales bacterium]|nr:hypothetical protein [Bacteroidales bacterium]